METQEDTMMDSVKGVLSGLSIRKILSDVDSELGRMGVQGQAEMAAALFSESNAYVPYGRGQNPSERDGAEVQKAEPQQAAPQQDQEGRSR